MTTLKDRLDQVEHFLAHGENEHAALFCPEVVQQLEQKGEFGRISDDLSVVLLPFGLLNLGKLLRQIELVEQAGLLVLDISLLSQSTLAFGAALFRLLNEVFVRLAGWHVWQLAFDHGTWFGAFSSVKPLAHLLRLQVLLLV